MTTGLRRTAIATGRGGAGGGRAAVAVGHHRMARGGFEKHRQPLGNAKLREARRPERPGRQSVVFVAVVVVVVVCGGSGGGQRDGNNKSQTEGNERNQIAEEPIKSAKAVAATRDAGQATENNAASIADDKTNSNVERPTTRKKCEKRWGNDVQMRATTAELVQFSNNSGKEAGRVWGWCWWKCWLPEMSQLAGTRLATVLRVAVEGAVSGSGRSASRVTGARRVPRVTRNLIGSDRRHRQRRPRRVAPARRRF